VLLEEMSDIGDVNPHLIVIAVDDAAVQRIINITTTERIYGNNT
jgi:hypothetical protein